MFDTHIRRATEKSGRRIVVTVPLHGDGKAVVAELRADREAKIAAGKVPSAYVLTTNRGERWSKDSLTQAFIRAAASHGIEKRLHDLRGTAITGFVLAGVTDEQIADIVGWEPSRVRRIRTHYVDRERVVMGVISQLEKAVANG